MSNWKSSFVSEERYQEFMEDWKIFQKNKQLVKSLRKFKGFYLRFCLSKSVNNLGLTGECVHRLVIYSMCDEYGDASRCLKDAAAFNPQLKVVHQELCKDYFDRYINGKPYDNGLKRNKLVWEVLEKHGLLHYAIFIHLVSKNGGINR